MTYSLSVTGANANQHCCAVETVTLSDAQATTGGMQAAMAQGTYFLCKNPDGSQSYYRLDAERSTPSVPVLIAAGP
jgi:expansin (peptidoglycan-binding protein)